MIDPVAEFRAVDVERPKLRAVRSLVDEETERVTLRVGDRTLELPGSLLGVLLAAADALGEGDTVALVSETAEVSPAQAAKLLGVSRQYVDRLVADGVLPVRRLPGSAYRKIPVRAVLAERDRRQRTRDGIRRIVTAAEDAGLDY